MGISRSLQTRNTVCQNNDWTPSLDRERGNEVIHIVSLAKGIKQNNNKIRWTNSYISWTEIRYK